MPLTEAQGLALRFNDICVITSSQHQYCRSVVRVQGPANRTGGVLYTILGDKKRIGRKSLSRYVPQDEAEVLPPLLKPKKVSKGGIKQFHTAA